MKFIRVTPVSKGRQQEQEPEPLTIINLDLVSTMVFHKDRSIIWFINKDDSIVVKEELAVILERAKIESVE